MSSPDAVKRTEAYLLPIFEKLCTHYRVKKTNSHLRRILAEPTTTVSQGRRLSGDPGYKAHVRGANGAVALPLERIELSSVYVGSKQLRALADLLRPVCSGTCDAGCGEWFYFSLVPFLTHFSLSNTQLDFTVSEVDAVDSRMTTTNGTAVIRYVLEALQHHPSLAVLDLTGNPIGPHLFTALCRLLDATRTLRDVRLTGALLTEEQLTVLEAKMQRNQLWCEAHRGQGWHCHYVRWKELQTRWLQDTLAQDNALRLFVNVRRSEQVVDWVCHFTENEVETFPFLQYYKNGATRSVLPQETVEMLEGAFNPSYFERMGTSMPVNTPQLPYHFQYRLKEKEEFEALKYAMAHSNLLVAVREMLFPTDTVHADANNASWVHQTRFDQWDILLTRLVHFMVPAYYHADEVVYYLNDQPYWLSFLPFSEGAHRRIFVKQLFINKETGIYDEVFVHEGQFFGCEVVGGASLYYTHNPIGYQRASTATVHSTSEIPGVQPDQAEMIRVWQLPFEVGFFFLFQPFCEFHSRTASRLVANPLVQTWAPHLHYLLSYPLNHGRLDEQGTIHDETPNGSMSRSSQAEFVTVMDARRFKESVTLLIEGHFVMRGYDKSGKWVDRVLAAPAVIIDSQLYAKDGPEREVMKQVWARKEGPHKPIDDAPLGKDFMLEQYRASRGSLSTEGERNHGEQLSLYAHRASVHRWGWVENERFATLPLAMRLYLTNKCIIL